MRGREGNEVYGRRNQSNERDYRNNDKVRYSEEAYKPIYQGNYNGGYGRARSREKSWDRNPSIGWSDHLHLITTIETEHCYTGLIGRTGLIHLPNMTGTKGIAHRVGETTIIIEVQAGIIPRRGKEMTVIETGVRKTDAQRYMRI